MGFIGGDLYLCRLLTGDITARSLGLWPYFQSPVTEENANGNFKWHGCQTNIFMDWKLRLYTRNEILFSQPPGAFRYYKELDIELKSKRLVCD